MALLPEWHALYEAFGRTLFQHPEWHRLWWAHIGAARGWTPYLAEARVGGRLVALAPLAVCRTRGIRKLEWAGMDVFDYPDILAAQDVDTSAFWQKIRASNQYDIARLRSVRSDSATYAALRAIGHEDANEQPIYVVNLAHESGQAWFNALSKNSRATYQAKVRRIRKAGILSMEVISDAEKIPEIIANLVRLKAEWCDVRGLENSFGTEPTANFITELALHALADGVLHLSVLKCDNRVLATHMGFVSDDGFYWYLTAFDPVYSAFSPGRVHMFMLIMWAIDHGYRRFDFLRGDDQYKRDMGHVERTQSDFTFSRGLLGSVVSKYRLVQDRLNARRAADTQQDRPDTPAAALTGRA